LLAQKKNSSRQMFGVIRSDGRWVMLPPNILVQNRPTRRVSIRQDGEDFVVVSLAENFVVFRNNDAGALRKVCRSLRWDIAIDSSPGG
jgi:hypothetical protein